MRHGRIALTEDDGLNLGLPYFDPKSKKSDARHAWWTKNGFGDRCWELDALDPRVLRERVSSEIEARLDLDAWERCKSTEAGERKSMSDFFARWKAS